MTPVQNLLRESSVVRLFLWGYFSCILVGWLVLQLPLCQKSVISGIDTLFTTASAVSTTGLVTLDVGKTFSFLGQIVLLLLIQLGGVGYLIFSSYILLTLKQKFLDIHRKSSLPTSSLCGDLTMLGMIKQAAIYTAICELSGLVVLYCIFKSDGVDASFWSAIFHSISAFCSAGFSLFPSNMEAYKNHLGLNITLSLLSLLGVFGFFLWMDLLKKLPDRNRCRRFIARIFRPFVTTAIFISASLFLLMAPFTQESTGFQKLLIAFFQTISAITTTGFNTIDFGSLPSIAHLFFILLMLLGVTLIGNGVNMKGTSFPVLLRLATARVNGKRTTALRSQKSFLKRLQIAISPLIPYLIVLLIFGPLLALIEKQPLLPLFFETASALCTIGFSTGITAELSTMGKSLLILLMLLGRIGILILGFAISLKDLSWERDLRHEPAI